MPATFVVVATMPRSGSALLCEMLAQHPEILGFGEIFNEDKAVREGSHNLQFGDGGRNAYAPKTQLVEPYLDLLDALARLRGKRCVSLKLMREHYAEVWHAFEQRPVSTIYLYLRRRNVLQAVVSHKLALLTNKWHARKAEDREAVEASRVVVEPHEVEQAVQNDTTFANYMRSLSATEDVFSIDFDTFVANPAEFMPRIFRLCRVDGNVSVEPTQVRLNTRPMNEVVENWDALRAHFDKTPQEDLFADELHV